MERRWLVSDRGAGVLLVVAEIAVVLLVLALGAADVGRALVLQAEVGAAVEDALDWTVKSSAVPSRLAAGQVVLSPTVARAVFTERLTRELAADGSAVAHRWRLERFHVQSAPGPWSTPEGRPLHGPGVLAVVSVPLPLLALGGGPVVFVPVYRVVLAACAGPGC